MNALEKSYSMMYGKQALADARTEALHAAVEISMLGGVKLDEMLQLFYKFLLTGE